ncbi:MAG: hypothetical protein GC190_19570 [Alphaproteobacteria bacterium]|nr:hypothetical protein [Alphaproteobacteria bacterium]
MKFKVVLASVFGLLLLGGASGAQAGDSGRAWCRHTKNPDSPMTWSEGFGVSKCNDRASTPYRPWKSAQPIPRDQNDPMTARDDWRGELSAYDSRYDDLYDRRSHRYR